MAGHFNTFIIMALRRPIATHTVICELSFEMSVVSSNGCLVRPAGQPV